MCSTVLYCMCSIACFCVSSSESYVAVLSVSVLFDQGDCQCFTLADNMQAYTSYREPFIFGDDSVCGGGGGEGERL